MSLADRLSSVDPQRSRNGCGTCEWLNRQPEADRKAWIAWINDGHSLVQLWQVSVEESAYPLSLEAMRLCIRMHHR